MLGPDQGVIPSTGGPLGSGQFKAPVQVPYQATFPHQMGVGGPPSPHMSVTGANIQQLDENMGRNFEKWLKFTISQTQSMVAGNSGGNYDPQVPCSSSSSNVEGNDSMNNRMADLSLNDFQHQTPYRSPPASTSPFNFPPSSSGGPNFNTYYGDLTKHDHGVHHTNVDSFNEHNNTLQDSFNDNSFVNSSRNRSCMFYSMICLSKLDVNDSFDSATESNPKRGFLDPDVPIKIRKKRNSGVRTSPDPNRMDEEPSSDETDEQIPTAAESTVDSSRKSSYRFVFLIAYN